MCAELLNYAEVCVASYANTHIYLRIAAHYASERIYNLYDFSQREHSIHKHTSTPFTLMLLVYNVKFVTGFYFTYMRTHIYMCIHVGVLQISRNLNDTHVCHTCTLHCDQSPTVYD